MSVYTHYNQQINENYLRNIKHFTLSILDLYYFDRVICNENHALLQNIKYI